MLLFNVKHSTHNAFIMLVDILTYRTSFIIFLRVTSKSSLVSGKYLGSEVKQYKCGIQEVSFTFIYEPKNLGGEKKK